MTSSQSLTSLMESSRLPTIPAVAMEIIGLVQRPEHWQAMRKASRLRFEQRFTWRAFVDTLSGQWGPAGLISRSR